MWLVKCDGEKKGGHVIFINLKDLKTIFGVLIPQEYNENEDIKVLTFFVFRRKIFSYFKWMRAVFGSQRPSSTV